MAENNMPIISKRVWNMVRVLYYMLRKGISKSKLQADIDLLLKRSKTAGKARVHGLVFPHLTSHGQRHNQRRCMSSHFLNEYEFSCSNTPAHTFPIFHAKRNKHSHFFGCTHAPMTNEEENEEDVATANAVKMVLEMLNNHNDINTNDQKMEGMMVQPSPALPGFGRSPAIPVRQLRVTDSPFPLHDVNGDRQVDEKADKFIANFYNDLKKQRIMATPSPRRS